MAPPRQPVGVLVTIDLFGGPHDGKSAPRGSSNSCICRISDYLALKQAQGLFAKLLALAADPRLPGRAEAEPPLPPGALSISEAHELTEKALPRYRRWLQGRGQPAERLSDEEIWSILRARLLGDLAWADIGVIAHFDSLRDFAFDILDIDLSVPQP